MLPHRNENSDSTVIYDPTSIEMLKSNAQREVPEKDRCEYLSGTRHPTVEDIKDLMGESSTGSLTLPCTTPLLADRHDPLNRKPHYCTDLVFDSDQRSTHFIVLGPTGAGKNTRVIDHLRLSAIKDQSHVVINFSLKSSDYGSVAAICEKYGKKLIVVNLNDAWRSVGFGPLATKNGSKAFDVVSRFGQSVRNPSSNDSEFWTQWLVTALMGCYEEGINSFPKILNFFSTDSKQLIRKLRSHQNSSSRKLADFLAGGSHNADTVLATIISALNLFRSEEVGRVMSKDELRLESVMNTPVCIHVEMPETSLETLRPLYQMLARMITDQAIENAESRGSDNQLPVTVFFDDLPSLGPVLNPSRLMTFRSRGIGIVTGAQSLASLERVYGNATHALLDNFHTTVVLAGGSALDSEFFSKSSGEQLVSLPSLQGESSGLINRPLVSSAAIRHPEYEHFLLGKPATIFHGAKTFQAYLQKTYELPLWSEFIRKGKSVTGRERLRKKRLRKQLLEKPEPAIGGKPSLVDMRGWTDEQFTQKIKPLRLRLKFEEASRSAQAWWKSFEVENKERQGLVVKLLEELTARNATLNEFFLAYVYSNTDNIMANLHYLDYVRIKKNEEDRKKRKQTSP